VDEILVVGQTGATATGPAGSDASAEANAVAVAGEPLGTATGGSQQGVGRSEGNAFDTGSTPVGQVEVAPWQADVSEDDAGSTATGEAALLRLYLLNTGAVDATVLGSTSSASHQGTSSSASASSDGANVGLADLLQVVLLHSESSSDGTSHSYLASVNGSEIGSSDTFEGCGLEVPSVATVGCLKAEGGEGSDAGATNAVAEDADVGVLGEQFVAAGSTTGAGGDAQGAAAAPAPAVGGDANDTTGASNASSTSSARSSGGLLPRTGADAWRLAMAGVAVALLGACTRRIAAVI
jgi:hypothetical protein